MPSDRDLQRNNTLTLILAVLADEPRHGYSIAREIEVRSQNCLTMGEGALYPALRALENEKLIAGNWEVQPSGPARKVYMVTDSGRAEFAKRAEAWREYSQAVNCIVGGKLNEQPA